MCRLCSSPLFPFSSGLNTLYQGEAELSKLLKLVLTEGDYDTKDTSEYNLQAVVQSNTSNILYISV